MTRRASTRSCRSTARTSTGILDEIATIREGKPTAVLVTNLFNDMIAGPGIDPTWYYTPEFLETSRAGAALVIDAFNAAISSRRGGSRGDRRGHARASRTVPTAPRPIPAGWFSKDFGDLNQGGHDAFAAAMMRVGFAPLVVPTD